MTASLIAVASGKGGVGKTFLAISLAQAFARQGQRTLLVDGDVGLANVDVQLGLQPRGDLLAVVSGAMDMAAAIAPCPAGGFDVLAGRSGSGALRGLGAREAALIAEGLGLVRAKYDRTVVDLAAGLDDMVLETAARCGRTLVVLTDEPTSLTDAYALIKVLSQRPAAPLMAIAVNAAADAAEGRRTYAALQNATQRFLGFAPPLAGVVRRDSHVREAIRSQTPFLTRYPASGAAADIAALAAALDAAFAPSRPEPRLAGVK
ncbi:MAG: P-loop NTPase [Alphaproteobacteria bacterium]|nr:P-loop NTPase [Alphaproteobacteria bacterium]